MDAQAVTIAADNDLQAEETEARPPRGRRKDHDTLPPEIQALYVENLSVLRRMREVHLRLRNLSLETASCPTASVTPSSKSLSISIRNTAPTGRATTNTDRHRRHMKRTASISEILRPLKDAPFQAYLSSALQVADILEWVLEQTGTAEVWQTSFSISEEFLRRLFFLKRKRPISRFNLVLDHKATNKTIKLWSFIVQVVDRTFLADNHSKILLVRSDRGDTVAVVTSQNLTRGNRAESAFISTSPEIFAISTPQSSTSSRTIPYR